ncbi:MAG TPA: MG2 domain-containing protein, partial [Nevskia sp.]|nr:MG2 domain-containing protein [Nevskia sp.]
PEKGKFRSELPAGLADDAGRALGNANRFPLDVQTAEAPPLAKFGADFGILELSEGGVLPVTLRNVESEVAAAKAALPAGIPGKAEKVDDDAKIADWLKRVEKANESSGEWDQDNKKWTEHTGESSVFGQGEVTETFSVPKPHGAEAFEVVGIPLKQPGFYVVELNSPKLGAALLGDNRTRYVATSALVTNMAVHFKWGRESSAVFVTSLDSAAPVPNADIKVSDYCSGAELWSGRADSNGVAHIGAELPKPISWGGCSDNSNHPLMVSARANGDLSFTLTQWNRGITPSDFQLQSDFYQSNGPVLAHTVLDRSLFRAGETVSMKHLLRLHTGSGMVLPKDYPSKVLLSHQGDDQTYTLPLSWDARGSALSTWEIPKDAKLGTYDISLVYGDGDDNSRSLDSGSFRVEQYRVPSMHAIVQGPKEPLVNADKASLDLFVSYLSGGGAAYLPVKLRTQVQPKTLSFPGYDAFHFGGDEVKPGIQNGGGHGAFYDEDEDQQGDENAAPSGPAQVLPLALDGQGAARATVPRLPKNAAPMDLAAELEYQDANGETLSASARIALWPSAVVLGIQPDGWVATKDDLRFKVLALDLHGQPLAGQSVSVDGFQRITHSYRRRLVGGFYSYDNSIETKKIGSLCSGRTDEHGLLSCKVKSEESGQITVQATAQDAKNNRALASTDIWVASGDDMWFEAGPSDRMDVLPEKQSYESGQTARFQVRMPFREATALITVEREGVIDSFVTHLSGRDPVVEVPIKDEYSPNIYVSVLALRGRVGTWRTRLADLVHWLHLPFHVEGGS